jgi:hypothetical protein
MTSDYWLPEFWSMTPQLSSWPGLLVMQPWVAPQHRNQVHCLAMDFLYCVFAGMCLPSKRLFTKNISTERCLSSSRLAVGLYHNIYLPPANQWHDGAESRSLIYNLEPQIPYQQLAVELGAHKHSHQLITVTYVGWRSAASNTTDYTHKWNELASTVCKEFQLTDHAPPPYMPSFYLVVGSKNDLMWIFHVYHSQS